MKAAENRKRKTSEERVEDEDDEEREDDEEGDEERVEADAVGVCTRDECSGSVLDAVGGRIDRR